MAKVIQFGKNEDAVLDPGPVEEDLAALAESVELKQTILESIKEEGRHMLALAGLKDLVFTMDEESAGMFVDAPLEIYAMDPDNPGIFGFTADQGDTVYRIQAGLYLNEEQDRADLTFALTRTDEDGYFLYNMEEGWEAVPSEAVSGLCRSQIEILQEAEGEENELTEFVAFSRVHFGAMDDEDFISCKEAYAELIEIFDDVKDYCIYGVIRKGEDEHIPVLVPRDPVVQGICVAYEDGVYWLCQQLADLVPVKVAGFKDPEGLEESLDLMLDHFYPDQVYVIPLSGEAYVKAEELEGDFEIFAGHPLTAQEEKAFEGLMNMVAELEERDF